MNPLLKEEGSSSSSSTGARAGVESSMPTNVKLGFFFAGLFNNISHCIILAGAKEILASSVGFVFIASTLPGISVKLSGPYWFHYISYKVRMTMVAISFFLSYTLVGLFSGVSIGLCFLGIILGAAGSAVGEASFLALSSFYSSPRTCITYWSSGTGFSGVIGYGWYVIFTLGLQSSFAVACFVANIFALSYYYNFIYILGTPMLQREIDEQATTLPLVNDNRSISSTDPASTNNINTPGLRNRNSGSSGDINDIGGIQHCEDCSVISSTEKTLEARTVQLTFKERLHHTLALWPYMIPLFVVYFGEYAMQSGCWAAIGFPVEDQDSRQLFYEFANWTYQFGVLLSRSSGTWITWINLRELWLMPMLQLFLLIFFILDALYKFWYDWGLIFLCFVVGLLGGACYVHGFSRLSESVDPSLREFSLSAASVGDSFGVILGDIVGIFIQQSIYSKHDLSDDN